MCQPEIPAPKCRIVSWSPIHLSVEIDPEEKNEKRSADSLRW